MKRHTRGFTLIELLVAMAILAVVSLMAVQSLSGALFQRDILTRIDDDATELARALALLRHDLEAVAPVPRLDDDGAQLPSIAAASGGVSLMRAGLGALPGAPSGGFGRVDWELDAAGALTRQVTSDASVEPNPSARVTIMTGVSALRLAALRGSLPAAETPTELPPGFELILTHQRHGTIRIAVAR